MAENSWEINEMGEKILHLFREDDPDIGALVPGAPPVVAEHRLDLKSRRLQPLCHLTNGQRAERQLEPVLGRSLVRALDVPLFKDRGPPASVLPTRLVH